MKASELPGETPLTEEEKEGLIPDHITTVEELNAWEAANILRAQPWAFRRHHNDLLTDRFVQKLHKKMFDQTWAWAGKYRRSDKSIGIHWRDVPVQVRELLMNIEAWKESSVYSADEISARAHHQMVAIHPFSNGNGRHARMFANMLLRQLGGKRFTWGRANLHREGEFRSAYIDALRAADKGDIRPLLAFARS